MNEHVNISEKYALLSEGNDVYLFDTIARDNRGSVEEKNSSNDFSKWESSTTTIKEWRVFNYGEDNKLPKTIQETIKGNNVASRTLTKKVSLLFGQGAELYETKRENGVHRVYIDNPTIENWLQRNNYEDSLLCAAVDFYHSEGCFYKVRQSIGSRLGLGSLPTVEYIDLSKCRLACKKNNKKNRPTHVLIGDWNDSNNNEYEVFPLFDMLDPKRHKVSIYYSKLKTFGLETYAVPDLFGSLEWIKRASAIPHILKAYSQNSLNLKYHVKSPNRFWEEELKMFKSKLSDKKIEFTPSLWKKHELEVLRGVTSVLSGEENVGKFFHSKSYQTSIGTKVMVEEWKFEPIDQKIKEFVEAQLEIAKQASFSITAGLALHNALAGVGADGKSDSGSEQIYAYKNHILTETRLPEIVITKLWNILIRHYWPNENVKLGFYYLLPEKEEDITKSKRHQNTEA